MDCLNEETVLAFVGGALQGATLESVERHLVGCPACAALVAVAAPIAPPAGGAPRRLDQVTVGRYQLQQLLGRGGMGEVYAGYDPELDRRVALKILRADVRNPDAHRVRFMREAQAVARLDHANVVGIYDVGNAGGRIFLAMELVQGQTLRDWLAHPRAVPDILRVFWQAGRGLQAAHQAGIVHRDFKPHNVMVGQDGAPRVMDFGLAASAEPESGHEPRLTAAGSILGTPHYMSPEQLLGQRADARADQFSFCVALWEALHGALPFTGDTWIALRADVLDGRPQPGPLARRVPRRVQAALLRGLSLKREDRFASMGELLAALTAPPPSAGRRLVTVAAAALAVAAVTTGVLVVRGRARRAAACDPAARLDGVWGASPENPARTAIRAAFTAAARDVPDAPARLAKLTAILDDDAAAWSALWRESCEARADGNDEDHVAQRALDCLDRHRRELSALSNVLAHADAKVARRAMSGVAALPSLTACRDPAVLRTTVPVDEATRDRLVPLEDALMLLRTQAATGRDAQALEQVAALLGQVRGARDAPLLAETLIVAARIQSPFDPDGAVPLYQEGFRTAEAAALPHLSGEAAIQLAAILGAVQHRFVDAERWVGRAEVSVAHAQGPDQPRLRGWFLDTRGSVEAARGRWRDALADFASAVATREQAPGPVHPELGTSLAHLSRAAVMLDDAPAALAAANRAGEVLTALFPADSYEVGTARLARARALVAAGRAREAAADLEAARAALERTLGHDHPFLADPMTVQGEIDLAGGDAAAARDVLERAWEMRSTQVADAGVREETAFALARAIWVTSRDRGHALELAREARDGYGAYPDLAGRRAAVDGWMGGHPDRTPDGHGRR